jgi:cytochrome c-type biogenesis protein CcmH
VSTPLAVILVGAVLAAAAAFWTLRAARRAGGDARVGRSVLIACAGASVIALAAYVVIGRPDLPGAAYASRLEALRHRSPETYTMDEALAVLAEGARTHPRDATPHLFSGEILLANGRPQEAARAFDAALRRDPQSAQALLGLAKSLVAVEGRFTPEALALFEQAAAVSNDPAPWLYRAMAAMEQGQDAQAQLMWREALARMDENDPRREMARRFALGEQP